MVGQIGPYFVHHVLPHGFLVQPDQFAFNSDEADFCVLGAKVLVESEHYVVHVVEFGGINVCVNLAGNILGQV